MADVCIDGHDVAVSLVKQGLGVFTPQRPPTECKRNLALAAFIARLMAWLPQFRLAFLWVVGGASLAVLLRYNAEIFAAYSYFGR